ncbi:Fe(2+) transporter permease subunit FeoB [Phaeovulum sp.]|uniref:Fe(2+) transporter permease subunit FeoB n=1 Tax=Phaeovulum sp. TaxID=2934796 RepID=UPI0035615B28
MSRPIVALLGNPNCGKTTLFNLLTGNRQMVGNWPGVTVERKSGRFSHAGETFELVDLPGTYSLGSGQSVSPDERIARDYALSAEAQVIINIVDASNIERNLYLTLQLIEMGLPVVVALSMMDVAKTNGIVIDTEALAAELGCAVVPIVASTGQGIKALKDAVARAVAAPHPAHYALRHAPEVEAAVELLVPKLLVAGESRAPRGRAIELLEGDDSLLASVPELADEVRAARRKLYAALGYDPDTAIASSRYDAVAALTTLAVRRVGVLGQNLSDRIDRVVLNRVLGIPIFLAVMYAMFMFSINLGSAFIDFFDIAAGTIFVDGTAHLLGLLGSPDWLTVLLATGVGGGVQTVATFIPVIGFLFLALSLLEDSGYMARAAYVMDRFMRMLGLPGKSFVPLIVGFGCSVPAVMATRTLEAERDRIMTVAMVPFMSCGARLPVYALFAAAFFSSGGQNLVFALYMIGITAAVLTGLVLRFTLLPGAATPFVMELPAYHLPTLRAILRRSFDRLYSFVVGAGRVLVAVVVVLAFLNSWGQDGSFGNEDSENSVLSAVGRGIVPVFQPMGISPDNWPAAVGVFTGLLAKEAVVGTLNALYTQAGAGEAASADDAAYDLWGGLGEAWDSIGENFRGLADSVADPLGLSLGELSDADSAAAEQEVEPATFGAMRALFDGQVGAFAYLLMVLLYMPCSAAIAAVRREVGWGWTGFVSVWTILMGWGVAVIFYQAATFARDPETATLWIAAVLGAFAAFVLGLRIAGRRANPVARRDPGLGQV